MLTVWLAAVCMFYDYGYIVSIDLELLAKGVVWGMGIVPIL